MKTHVWPYGLILTVFFLAGPGAAAVFHTNARVTVVSGVEINLIPQTPGTGILAEMGIRLPQEDTFAAGQPDRAQRLRITGPADLSVHVSLLSMRGEPLAAFGEQETEVHGPGGELLLELGDLPEDDRSGGQPMLLFLEYE